MPLPSRRFILALCCLSALSLACSNDGARQKHFAAGQQFLAAGKPAKAIVEFRNAIRLDDRWGEARYQLAEAYSANGDVERAYREYIRAADLMPTDTAAQLKATAYLVLARQYEDAKTRVRQLLEKEPKNIEAHILLGNALAGLRDLEGALTQINEAIQLDPERSGTYTNLALIRVAQGDRQEARAAFEKAVETDERSVAARLALANFQWSVGETVAAEQSLKQASQIDGANVLTHRALATFYMASGRADAAEPHLKFIAEKTRTRDAWFTLADYYISMGRRDTARQVLVPLVAAADAPGAAATRLAGLTYLDGQIVEAHRMLDKVLSRDPTNALALLLNARWSITERKEEQALELSKAAITSKPRMVAAYYVRGLAEVRTHRIVEAMRSFTEVLRLNPRAAAAQLQLSRLHLARNAIDSAVLFAEEALQNAPGSVDARLLLSRAWIARSDRQRAEGELEALRKEAPNVAGVHALEGSLRMLTGDIVAARAAFARALKLDGSSMEALVGITSIDVVQNNVQLARARIEARLATDSDDPELLVLAAKVLIADHDIAKAEAALRRAIDLDPLEIEPFSLLGRLYADQNRLDAASTEFADINRRVPSDMASRIMGAMIVHAQGNFDDAKRRYTEILKMEPRAILAANNLANMFADEGENLVFAQQLAESALEQSPAHAEIQDTVGWIYYKRELHGKAVEKFLQSIATEPDNPTYHFHLGLAYSKHDEPDRARDAFRKALELRPRFGEAQQALASLDR